MASLLSLLTSSVTSGVIGFYGAKAAFPYCKHFFLTDDDDEEDSLEEHSSANLGTDPFGPQTTHMNMHSVACASLIEPLREKSQSGDLLKSFVNRLKDFKPE